MSKTTLHLSKQLSRIRIMANYWHLIVRRCEIGVCVFIFALPVLAATDGPEWLKERYATLASKLNGTAFGAPVYIESDDRDGMMRGEVPGLEKCGEAQPGEDVQKLLAVAVPAMLIVLIVLAAPTGAVRRSLGGGGACRQLRRQRQDIRSPSGSAILFAGA